MTTSDFLALSWPDRIVEADRVLACGDREDLDALNVALHQLFWHEVEAGTDQTRAEFTSSLMAMLESGVAKQRPRPDPVSRLLTEWEHLELLLGALLHGEDARTEVQRIVESRRHGGALLEIVGRQQPGGIRQQELAAALEVSEQNLSQLLRHFESFNIVVRIRQGRHSYVRLGAAGRLLVPRELPLAAPAHHFELSEAAPIYTLLINPVGCFAYGD